MTAFLVAVAIVLEIEGGYVHDPNDPGGATKYGISQRSYPHVDIANLTEEDAIEIYRRDFWDPVALRVEDPRLRMIVFDSAVHSGLYTALGWVEEVDTFGEYVAHRVQYMKRLSGWPRYGDGWLNRIGRIVDAAYELYPASQRQRVEVLNDHRPSWSRVLAALRGTSGPVIFNLRPLVDGEGHKLDVGPVPTEET